MRTRSKAPSHSIDISEADGVRFLHFGSEWIQGAMRIARPWSLELAYTRELMAGLILKDPGQAPRKLLLIGLGAGSLAKFAYRNLPDCRITVVEINPQVEFVARQYFKLPDDPKRLRVVIDDGAAYLLKGGEAFDWIIVDGFDDNACAGALDTLPFYQACRARLADNGLLAVNLLGHNRGFKASANRISQAFDGRSLVFPSCDSGNTIAVAVEGPPLATSLEEMRTRAGALKKASGLDLRPTITRLQLSQRFPDGQLHL